MKLLKNLFTILLLTFAGNLLAQDIGLGEFKPGEQSYGLNKLKGKADKIYIAGFNVVYQIYNEKQDFKQGGSGLGGTYKGDAKAEVSVGLDGLTNQDVQQITDKLYADYVAALKTKGLTVINAEEAGKTDSYSDYIKMAGGNVSLAQFPGTMTTSPTGYEYFIKKMNKSGKVKAGGFLGQTQTMYAKLSKELDDAIIADVNMYVMFVEDKNAFKGNGANIKITTSLRLAGPEAIVMTDDRKGLKLKGQNTVTSISSALNFYHGKIGAGATTVYTGTLKKGLGIGGVIEDTKIQSFANRRQDFTGVKTIYGTFYNPDDVSSKAARVVAVDAAKYNEGVYMAAHKFMDHHTQKFLNSF